MKMQFSNPLDRIREAVSFDTNTETEPEPPTVITHAEAVEILSSERRRWVIEFLADQEPTATVTLSDLAEHVASRENACTVRELSSQERERVYVALYQSHLGTLDDVIDYDNDRKTITPTRAPARLWTAYQSFQRELER
jgi:hypothetical protein